MLIIPEAVLKEALRERKRALLWDNVTAELRHPEEVEGERLYELYEELKAEKYDSLKGLECGITTARGYYVEFEYKGLKICIDHRKAVIKNSLHKACKDGLNIEPYEAEELSTLYNELEEITRLPIRKAQIQYLEIGYNSTAPRPTNVDVEAMRQKIPKGFKLDAVTNDSGEQEYGRLFPAIRKGEGKKLVVYNKTQEIRDKKKVDPPEEITRIEAKRTAKHLKELRGGKPFLTLEDLTDPEVMQGGITY